MTQATLDWGTALGVNVVSALIILLVAYWASGWAKARISRLSETHARIDPTLFGFLANLARYFILLIAVIFVLGRFGIQTTSLVALIGAAGLAIGLALQGALTNLAAGVMIVLFRPIRNGDFVEIGGCMGTVRQITLFFTELDTADNLRMILPNGDVWARPISNYSVNPTRRCELRIGVSYDTDLKKAEAAIRRAIEADERAFADPAPVIKVAQLGDSSVDFVLRVWCDAGHLWALRCDLTRAIKDAFDADGITIPFPTRTVIQG